MKNLLAIPLFFIICSLEASPTSSYRTCKESTPEATHLKIIETELTVFGQSEKVFSIVPDGLKRKEGDCFNVIVENQTSTPATLHWHGLILPYKEDGVAFLTQPPIAPGKSQEYNFEIVQSGTFWMHSHYGLNEQRLMAAPLILEKNKKNSIQEVILFLEDFSFTPTQQIWTDLRKNLIAAREEKGSDWTPVLDSPMKKKGSPDLNDVRYDAFLTNRQDISNAPVEEVNAGEKVLLRIINGSSASNFHIHLGGLQGKIIATDGNPVVPMDLNDFPIATAQRYDVLIEIPKEGGAFPILAEAQGTNQQTGLILKTKEAKAPTLLPNTKTIQGAITNKIEKELKALAPLTPKKVDRTLIASLEGNMQFYTWAINKHIWPHNVPLIVKEGERVSLTFKNNTEMSHPMHLHGHTFQVVEIDGDRFSGALRDTILVMPDQTVTVEFDANNPGLWAMHCHILYHSFAGMITIVQYEGIPLLFSEKQILDYSHIYDKNKSN